MPRGVTDISGRKFGRLTVVSLLPRNEWGGRDAKWKCKCDCGSECFVTSCNLRSGHVKSCGCLRRELAIDRRKSPDLSGQRFWNLTVLHRVDRPEFRGKGKHYRCICDCGREIDVSAHNILIGHIKSCGCRNGYKGRRKELYAEITGVTLSDGDSVIFLDGDASNLNPQNMMAVSRQVYNQMYHSGLFTQDSELTRTAALACELSCKIVQAEKDTTHI